MIKKTFVDRQIYFHRRNVLSAHGVVTDPMQKLGKLQVGPKSVASMIAGLCELWNVRDEHEYLLEPCEYVLGNLSSVFPFFQTSPTRPLKSFHECVSET